MYDHFVVTIAEHNKVIKERDQLRADRKIHLDMIAETEIELAKEKAHHRRTKIKAQGMHEQNVMLRRRLEKLASA